MSTVIIVDDASGALGAAARFSSNELRRSAACAGRGESESL